MIGIGFALQFNWEMILCGVYVLFENFTEWYSIGPCWMRRKMIVMSQVVTLFGFEEDEVRNDQKDKLKRMTLKEFMLSDSQRAQASIDWGKDFAASEKWNLVFHYLIKMLFITLYVWISYESS